MSNPSQSGHRTSTITIGDYLLERLVQLGVTVRFHLRVCGIIAELNFD